MAFYNQNTGDITFLDPSTGEEFVIKTPVETKAWNSTPVTWTAGNTSTSSSDVVGESTTDLGNLSLESFKNTGSFGRKNHRHYGRNTIQTSSDEERTKQIIETTLNTSTSKTVSTASTTTSELLPFMRAKKITFSASGIKPNAKLRAVFGDEDVTKLCIQTTGKENKGSLKASPTGFIKGHFNLPGNRFKAGARIFKIFDSEDPTASFAEATYTAAGRRIDTTNVTTHNTEISKQKTINDTTFVSEHEVINQETIPPGISPNHVLEWIAAGRPESNIIRRGGAYGRWSPTRGWYDPVAQSFFVETTETIKGVFIHSIDLYFYQVEPGHDVEVQVRKMSNGLPTTTLIESYSVARLQSDKIKVSQDGTKHTRFTFPTPFFLPPNDEYCFVVTSTSTITSMWCAELGKKAYMPGDTIEPSGEIISKQPYLGSMFISQNNTTWTPQQNRDLKFKINRAHFKSDGQMKFINKAKSVESSPHNKRMKPDALEFGTESNKNLIKLYAHGHGLKPGDKFKLVFGDSFRNEGTAYGININDHLHMVEHKVVESNPTHITFSVLSPANGTGSGGGDEIWMLGWATAYSYAQLVKSDLQLDGTMLSYTLSGRDWNYYSSGVTGNHSMPENKIMDLSKTYVAKNQGDGGVTINVLAVSDSTSFTSPVLYADSMGIETHLNVINNIDYMDNVGKVSPDSSPAKYIQKEVKLENPADELKIFFDSCLPFGSTASVYYKIGANEISKNTKWVKIEANDGEGINISVNKQEYRSQKFEVKGLNEFKSFKVMIVMQSMDRLTVPKIKNYRAISLFSGE